MTPTLLIHGGAGIIQPDAFTPQRLELYLNTLSDIVSKGQQRLLAGDSAVDVVAYTVSLLEDCPLFNAGMGSVLTAAATIEMDACVMDGRDKSAGAVTCVSQIANPIKLAHKIMVDCPHVCLAGTGAENFAKQHGIQLIDNDSLKVAERIAQLRQSQQTGAIVLDHDAEDATNRNPIREKDKYGTVGAVALDQHGNLAAATSTGGMTNQAVGRVGDTPIIGAGCYADTVVAVSTTGTGEAFMRGVIAHDISARIRYAKQSLSTACDNAIHETLAAVGGEGGLIAIDQYGNIALPMNTDGMYRAIAIGNNPVQAKVFNSK